MQITSELFSWYSENKRELPWRNTREPYHIWLSEIMLQQTRIEQGLPYYMKFTEKYPSVFDLAEAPIDDVLKLWQGLGYYSRARNLHETAKYVALTLKGEFPKSYSELKKLKGVGDYTAAAIASFCYDEPVAVVDGNVYRVLSRLFDLDIPINSSTGIKEFKILAQEVLTKKDPATHNQAIMEFGAIQCKPQNPYCIICPLNTKCLALKNGTVKDLPVKLKKGKIKNRYFNYLVFNQEKRTLLEQRTGKGIWKGLYQFPLVESDNNFSEEELIASEEFINIIGKRDFEITLFKEEPKIHKLSHQHLHTRFWIIDTDVQLEKGIALTEIENYPVPVLIENFLNEYLSEAYN